MVQKIIAFVSILITEAMYKTISSLSGNVLQDSRFFQMKQA